MTARRATLMLAFVACSALAAGCGLRGDLERPPPLWGDPPREGPLDPRTVREAETRANEKPAPSSQPQDAADRTPAETTQPEPSPQ
ncbi:MAG: hypothetical protein KGS00_00495 [Alphaproteobacteria bacterium]|nr:hypothetical protein [Alphaproteobacteria bacterium]